MPLEKKKYIKDYQELHLYLDRKSLNKFYSHDAIYNYLNEEVFKKQDFINNIQEVADAEDKHYDVIYTVISLYFVDIFYDIIINIQERIMVKINIYGYLFLIIKFYYNIADKYKDMLYEQLKDEELI